jgi:quercetin dioxygenase-like cupin family protein
MDLKFQKEFEDKRGKILFLKHVCKSINIIEIKKGFARGGHFHKIDTTHFLLSGKIELHEENINTGMEKISVILSPKIISVSANIAHLLIALEDSLFFEVFENYEDTVFPKYRKIVETLMK